MRLSVTRTLFYPDVNCYKIAVALFEPCDLFGFGSAASLNRHYLPITLILYTSRTSTVAIAIQAVRV